MKSITVHRVFVVLYAIATVLTLIPNAMASKSCRLGYDALCSWTPYSTLILAAMLVLHVVLDLANYRPAETPAITEQEVLS